MYSIQFCWEDASKVIAVFEDRGLAIEYANFKKRTAKDTVFMNRPISVEVLDGDKQILRLFTGF